MKEIEITSSNDKDFRWKTYDQHNKSNLRLAYDGRTGCGTVLYNGFSIFWLAVFSVVWYK